MPLIWSHCKCVFDQLTIIFAAPQFSDLVETLCYRLHDASDRDRADLMAIYTSGGYRIATIVLGSLLFMPLWIDSETSALSKDAFAFPSVDRQTMILLLLCVYGVNSRN